MKISTKQYSHDFSNKNSWYIKLITFRTLNEESVCIVNLIGRDFLHLAEIECKSILTKSGIPNVDFVVKVDSLGDPSKIVSGTTQVTKSPDRLLIAEYVAQFLEDSGIMKDGFSFQAGAGGTNLAFALFLKEYS